jgi:hypothetical protein
MKAEKILICLSAVLRAGRDRTGGQTMNDELVKRLRDAAKMSEALAVLLPHSEGNATAKLYNEAADAIEELQKRVLDAFPKWISVEERLPIGGDDSGAICENVCLFMDDGTVSCGWMNGITKKVYYLTAIDDVIIEAPITRVTHWMPLPEPPKEG